MNKTTNSTMNNRYDVIILGAGTAGLFCAMQLRHLRVALVDHADMVGNKLRIAGGGMANMTNRNLSMQQYIGDNCHILKNILHVFPCESVLNLLETFSISYEERDYGQIFCRQPASHLVNAMTESCSHADFYLGERIQKVWQDKDLFHVSCKEYITAPVLVIATGSPAYPQLGASDVGMQLAKKWGHAVKPFAPVLTPLLGNEWSDLSGISVLANIYNDIGKHEKHEKYESGIRPLLFTHKGLSGPATLVASCFWKEGQALYINFLPHLSILDLIEHFDNRKKVLKNLVAQHLPQRLAQKLLPEHLQNRKVAELGKKDRQEIFSCLHEYSFTPKSKDSFAKAEAASGGVSMENLKGTLESTLMENLYFCGEVVDITGILGGYNIHFALASAKWVSDDISKKGNRPKQKRKT